MPEISSAAPGSTAGDRAALFMSCWKIPIFVLIGTRSTRSAASTVYPSIPPRSFTMAGLGAFTNSHSRWMHPVPGPVRGTLRFSLIGRVSSEATAGCRTAEPMHERRAVAVHTDSLLPISKLKSHGNVRVLHNISTIYAIGDVHGRSDLLDRMIAYIHEDSRQRKCQPLVIFLGDIVDKGPTVAEP